jgi:hypothetical protein
LKDYIVHQFAAKWNLPASLHVPGATSHPAMPERIVPGTLAELIRLAQETLPEPVRRRVRIECGEMFLGYEAIRRAYYSVYFPLPRGKSTLPPE